MINVSSPPRTSLGYLGGLVVLLIAFAITTASATTSQSRSVLVWADHGLHPDRHHASFDDAMSKTVNMATFRDIVGGMNHNDNEHKPEVIVFVAQETMDSVDNIRRALVSTAPSTDQPVGSWVIGHGSSQQTLDVMALTEMFRSSVPLESSYSPVMHVNMDTIRHMTNALQSQKSNIRENQANKDEKRYFPTTVVISVSEQDEMDLSMRGETATLVVARAIHAASALVEHKLSVVWMESRLESELGSRVGRHLLQEQAGDGVDELAQAAEQHQQQEQGDSANTNSGKNTSNPQLGATSPGKQTTASGIMPPPISPEGFMALLVSALLLLIFVPGFLCLFHIQTPYAFESAESMGDMQKKMQ